MFCRLPRTLSHPLPTISWTPQPSFSRVGVSGGRDQPAKVGWWSCGVWKRSLANTTSSEFYGSGHQLCPTCFCLKANSRLDPF